MEKGIITKLQEEIEVMERHLRIMKIIADKGPIGIIKLSEMTGFPPHKVRYSLRVLETHGLILPSSNGAFTTERAHAFIKDFKHVLHEMIERLKKLENALNRPL